MPVTALAMPVRPIQTLAEVPLCVPELKKIAIQDSIQSILRDRGWGLKHVWSAAILKRKWPWGHCSDCSW